MAATHIFPDYRGDEVHPAYVVAAGRASALFAVLAGVSLSLVAKRSDSLARFRVATVVRAVLLLVLGLALGAVDSPPLVILAYYALLFLVAVPLLGLPVRVLAVLAVCWALGSPLLSHLLRATLVPEFRIDEPGGLGLPAQLAVSGVYPVLTWTTYLLVGLAVGRLMLGSARIATGLLVGGLVAAAAARLVSAALLARAGGRAGLAEGTPMDPAQVDRSLDAGMFGVTPTGDRAWLLVAAPHSGATLDLVGTAGSALAVLGLCLLVTRRGLGPLLPVAAAGSMTLTLYTVTCWRFEPTDHCCSMTACTCGCCMSRWPWQPRPSGGFWSAAAHWRRRCRGSPAGLPALSCDGNDHHPRDPPGWPVHLARAGAREDDVELVGRCARRATGARQLEGVGVARDRPCAGGAAGEAVLRVLDVRRGAGEGNHHGPGVGGPGRRHDLSAAVAGAGRTVASRGVVAAVRTVAAAVGVVGVAGQVQQVRAVTHGVRRGTWRAGRHRRAGESDDHGRGPEPAHGGRSHAQCSPACDSFPALDIRTVHSAPPPCVDVNGEGKALASVSTSLDRRTFPTSTAAAFRASSGTVAPVIRVGLTGGIGSGKSEVARLLAEHGAVVVDADALAREAVEPGTPGLAAVVAEFGPDVLSADGSLDRAALGRIVFVDADKRVALEAIVHPYVGRRSAELMAAADPDAVVVYDVPLLVEKSLQDGYDVVVVVDAPDETRLRRLMDLRGMPEVDARARMAAQASRAERLSVADQVVANDGELEALRGAVDQLWSALTGQATA